MPSRPCPSWPRLRQTSGRQFLSRSSIPTMARPHLRRFCGTSTREYQLRMRHLLLPSRKSAATPSRCSRGTHKGGRRVPSMSSRLHRCRRGLQLGPPCRDHSESAAVKALSSVSASPHECDKRLISARVPRSSITSEKSVFISAISGSIFVFGFNRLSLNLLNFFT